MPAVRKRKCPLGDKKHLHKNQYLDSTSQLGDDLAEKMEETPKVWTITYPRKPNKSNNATFNKLELPYKTTQASPFVAKFGSESLDVDHVVLQKKDWADMHRYAHFVIENESYTNEDFVWVQPAAHCSTVAEKDFWVARILDVRADDPAHVYAKVAWLYWPHQLPRVYDPISKKSSSGARSYHGEFELIASNHMDIIDVICLAGKAPVEHWVEADEERRQTGLYWRQTYNVVSASLSVVRMHCRCVQPYKADLRMWQCTRSSCMAWSHEQCLIDDLIKWMWETAEDPLKVPLTVKESCKSKATKSASQPLSNVLTGTIDDNINEEDGETIANVYVVRNQPYTTWTKRASCTICGECLYTVDESQTVNESTISDKSTVRGDQSAMVVESTMVVEPSQVADEDLVSTYLTFAEHDSK